MYAIKAGVSNPLAKTFDFSAQRTMYRGKNIVQGDTIFIFSSESEGGPGFVACGVVTAAEAIARKSGVARQTPRGSITVRRTALAKRPLGRGELRPFSDWSDGRPETELNFKFYRQATNKIFGISEDAAGFLLSFDPTLASLPGTCVSSYETFSSRCRVHGSERLIEARGPRAAGSQTM